MPCDIIVCIKQVPHPEYLGKVTLDSTTGTINRAGVPSVVNPGDMNALEEALKIKEKFPGRVSVLTLGPPQAKKALEDALALEADNAFHLCDLALAGADTLATARALAEGIRKIGKFDLVLCGDTTIDSGTGQVALQVAEFLNLPCITEAEELDMESESTLAIRRKWERGYIRARVKLPAVIGVAPGINQPRLPTIMGIMAATQKEITTWTAADIGADISCVGLAGSPTCVYRVSEFHAKRKGELLTGPPEATVTEAVDRLVKLEVL